LHVVLSFCSLTFFFLGADKAKERKETGKAKLDSP